MLLRGGGEIITQLLNKNNLLFESKWLLFSLFKPNTCEQCKFYSEYKTADVLQKDKTVTRGKMRYCKKKKDELRDMEKCELFQLRGGEK
ncbi:hypothetical protein AB1K19_09745 [Bacillus licheniformis]|uniref:hypothetical protein n=1 Tax=Bacillus licheniformis TaxID=1402 RepID=UPI003B8D976C